jgi:hypothetical protein
MPEPRSVSFYLIVTPFCFPLCCGTELILEIRNPAAGQKMCTFVDVRLKNKILVMTISTFPMRSISLVLI